MAIVTGASSGIGRAAALQLARDGYRVTLAARRAERLALLRQEIASLGGEALSVPADLASERDTQRVVDVTLATHGRVDVLVNNAGFSPAAAIEQLPRAELRRTFEVNLLSGLHLAGQVIPVMRERGGGRIINVGSLAARVPAPLAATYAASKAAMEAAGNCLRLELAPWNIQVVLIVPGFVDTEVFDAARRLGECLRNDPSNPYRRVMAGLDRFSQESLVRALAPEAVARVVLRAARSARPRPRYFIPFSARLQSGLFAALPGHWGDRLLQRVYGGAAARAAVSDAGAPFSSAPQAPRRSARSRP